MYIVLDTVLILTRRCEEKQENAFVSLISVHWYIANW